MSIIITSDNYFVNNVLDILLVFVLGTLLLFFANAMKNENRFVMVYVSIIVICVNIMNTFFIHHNTIEEKKTSNMYNILTFINIYIIILMIFLSGLSYYINTSTN